MTTKRSGAQPQVPGLNTPYAHVTASVIASTVVDGRIEASELGAIAIAIAIDLDRAGKMNVTEDEALQHLPAQMRFLLEQATIAPGHEASLTTFAMRMQQIGEAGATPKAFLALSQELLQSNRATAPMASSPQQPPGGLYAPAPHPAWVKREPSPLGALNDQFAAEDRAIREMANSPDEHDRAMAALQEKRLAQKRVTVMTELRKIDFDTSMAIWKR